MSIIGRPMRRFSKLLIHHNWYQSFTTVAKLTGRYLSQYFEVEYATDFPVACFDGKVPSAVLYIHDTIDILTMGNRFQFRGTALTIAWSDTCLDPNSYCNMQALPGVVHIVASERNFQQFRQYGVSLVLPRIFNQWAIDEIMATEPTGCEYYAVIGYRDDSDRKNFDQLATVLERSKVLVRAVTNAEGPWERIEYGTLTEDEKYHFLANAKYLIWFSRGEGFGMPPIEAMSVGTPVIFSDVPAHNAFAVGLPVRAAGSEHFSSVQPNGNPIHSRLTNIDLDDACRVIHKSLVLSEDEYARLKMQCLVKSRRFRPEVVVEQLYRIAIADS